MPDTTELAHSRASDVRLSPDGNLLYAADADGFVRVYDTGTGALVTSWDIGQNLGGMDISPDGSFLMIVERNLSTTYRVDTATGAKTSYNYATTAWEGLLFDVAVLSDGTALFSQNFPGSGWVTLKVLDLNSGIYTAGQSIGQSAVLTRSPTGETVLIGEPNSSAGPIDIYQTGVGILHTAGAAGYNFGIQAFNGTLAAHYIPNEGIHVYDAQLDRQITLTGWNGGRVTDLEFSADGAWLYVLENQDNTIVQVSTSDWDIGAIYPVSEDVGDWLGQLGATRGGRLILDPQGRFFSVIGDSGLLLVSDLGSGATAGTSGADALIGTEDADSIFGFGGDDVIDALAGNDDLHGGTGNDLLRGGSGDDSLDGGLDYDTASYSDATSGVTVDASRTDAQDTGWGVDLLVNVEQVLGSDFADVLSTPGSVELFGGGGNDTLSGGTGADMLHGGTGDDTIFTGGFNGPFGFFADQVSGDDGDDTIVIDAPPMFSQGVYDGGAGFDTLELRAPTAAGGLFVPANSILAGIEQLRFGGSEGGPIFAIVGLQQVAASGITQVAGGDSTVNLILIASSPVGGAFTMPELTFVDWDSSASPHLAPGDQVTLTASGNGDFVLNARDGLASTQALTGGIGHDTLNGSDGVDVLNGAAGNNVLNGNGGDDVLAIVNTTFQGVTTTLTGAGSTFNGGDGFDVLSVGGPVDFAGALSGVEAIYLQAAVYSEVVSSVLPAELTIGSATFASLPATLMLAGTGTIVVEVAPGGSYDASGFGFAEDAAITHVVNGGHLAETISGLQIADTLSGGDGNDTLIGNGGNDALLGLGGKDTLIGGEGDDVYLLDDSDDAIFEDAGQGDDTVYTVLSYTLNPGVSVETLTVYDRETAYGVSLAGNEFGQLIYANNAANSLVGGGGADTLFGMGGNDTYYIDGAGDVVYEFAGGGADDVVVTTGSFELGYESEVERIMVEDVSTIVGTVNLFGNAFNQSLYGHSAGSDGLNGGGGADVLYGLGGDDSYVVDSADDTVVEIAGEGTDAVYATGSYALAATAEIELLSAYERTASDALDLTGSGYGQTIYGTMGSNFLNGNGGADVLYGLGGDDAYLVDDLDDQVNEFAGQGTDTVYAVGHFSLTAGADVEVLSVYDRATTGAINFNGNGFGQAIYGNAGNNVIDGKDGSDTIYLMGGTDAVYFSTPLGAGNVDAVAGFASGNDTLLLDSVTFAGLAPGALPAGAFALGGAAQDADDRILYDQPNGLLWFDADGNGAGAAVLFATLEPGTLLAASDFLVV